MLASADNRKAGTFSAMKYTISTSDTQILFTDAKGKSEKFDFITPIAIDDSIQALRKEITARHNATAATLSIMVELMDTPKLDSYKGVTPANEGLSKEFKSAVREIEGEYLKPLFTAPLESKGNSVATIQKMWTSFIEDLRVGGVWSNVGATVRQYYAIVGKLPCVYIDGNPQKDKLLSTHAMQKEIANLRTVSDTTDKGISGKLVDLMNMVKERNEKTKLGHVGTAIAALESLLNEFRAIDRTDQDNARASAMAKLTQADIDAKQTTTEQIKATERAVVAKQSIDAQAKAIADKAYKSSTKHARYAKLTHNETAPV